VGYITSENLSELIMIQSTRAKAPTQASGRTAAA
jgi:hypothetical protein